MTDLAMSPKNFIHNGTQPSIIKQIFPMSHHCLLDTSIPNCRLTQPSNNSEQHPPFLAIVDSIMFPSMPTQKCTLCYFPDFECIKPTPESLRKHFGVYKLESSGVVIDNLDVLHPFWVNSIVCYINFHIRARFQLISILVWFVGAYSNREK